MAWFTASLSQELTIGDGEQKKSQGKGSVEICSGRTFQVSSVLWIRLFLGYLQLLVILIERQVKSKPLGRFTQ